MDVLMHTQSSAQYSLDTAHTIEVTREEDTNGEFGSFGFTLLYEKPPIVGTIVPGGAAQRAGLKKDDIVLTVNGTDVRPLPHQKVVTLISQTPTAAVWLKVCDPDTKSPTGLGRSLGAYGSMSSSTPNFSRGMPAGGSHRRPGVRGMGGAVWEPPPKYSEVPPNRPRPGSGGLQLGPRVVVGGGGGGGVASMSPLNRQVLMPASTKFGLSSSPHLGGSGPLPQNGYGGPRQPPPSSSSSSSSDNCYTSASVMVLYIGPVEIPVSWSERGISSKCIQECTRRLLSQRQEFIEAFLEVSVTSMKVLNVSRNVLYQHKREELFYCGTCTDDEQYFAIVTRKLDPKLVDPEVGQTLHTGETSTKGHICHVFQVIRNKSILVLHAGDRTGNGGEAPNIKPKTVQILSCLTIIKAIEGLFIGDSRGGAVSSAQIIGGDPAMNSSSNTSFRSVGSSESAGSFESFPIYGGGGGGGAGPEKKRRKDVVDLRPSAFAQHHTSSSLTYGTGSGGGPAYLSQDPANRSRDYLHPMDTPAFTAMTSTSRSWYKVDSPREGGSHSRQGSFELAGRPESAGYFDSRYDPPPLPQRQRHPDSRRAAAFEKVKKISDESSISSHSSGGGGAVSPNKMAPPRRTSESPSPSKSMSHSSGSRSPSPPSSKHRHHPHHPHHSHRSHQRPEVQMVSDSLTRRRMMLAHHTPSKLSSGMALELGSLRSGALSPTTSTVGSTVSNRYRSTLRRQGSESSIMDFNQESMKSGAPGLPAKNGLLTSSQGSIMTVTTVADEENQDPQEVGRVGGWIASFDKLLEDPLGVTCLQQFLEKEHCEENILFWKEAREFSEKALHMSLVQLQAAAKKIYDQYLSPSSPHTVNVDDRAMKAVESRLDKPTPNIFAEAKEQIYQLLKMDCYMRFKKSELVKECLLADMEGEPLPIGPTLPATKNPWKRQKEFGFSRSLFGRFGRNRAVPPSPPMQQAQSKTKKDSKTGLKDSPGSRKTSRGGDGGSSEKKRSNTDIARPENFPPEKHLDILQVHKGNIFEVNLPNKVTKIMEVPKKGTVREAIQPVLKKNNYSLDVMDLKFADTLKTVSLDSPAHILVGQHIIVLKSAQTFTASFPDGPERILPADQRPVQELVARVLKEMGTLQNFAVYLENSRVPFNGTIEASTLVGQKVTVKYLGGQYMPADSNMEDLFHMIERLAGDTLEDQRTSPTPRNTPEPASPASSDRGGGAPPELQQRTRSHGSFRLSPRSSDSSPETRAKMRPRGGSTREKKPLSFTRSIGQVGSSEHRSFLGGKEELTPSPSSSRKFKRTQSGAVISKRQQQPPATDFRRTYSPPAGIGSVGKRTTSPPPPTSRPPPLPPTHQHNLGGGAYGSTPDTINRGGRGPSPGTRGSGSRLAAHPLDSLVREASEGIPSSDQSTTTSHGRQHSMPVQMPPDSYTPSSSSSSHSATWQHYHQQNFPPNPRRYTQQQHRTAAQRHNLTQNPELMRTGDQLVQREIEDYRHHQLTSSLQSSHSDASSSSATSRTRVTLSPTTHTLVPPDELTDSFEQHYKQTETFV